MAEKIKDAEDLMLENLFSSEPIADNGFSDRIVGRINRRLWLRRLSLPIAAAIGASISIKPLTGLVSALFGLVTDVATPEIVAASTGWLPPVHLIVMGGMLLVLAVVSVRMLEE
jgi:hypothetical protein